VGGGRGLTGWVHGLFGYWVKGFQNSVFHPGFWDLLTSSPRNMYRRRNLFHWPRGHLAGLRLANRESGVHTSLSLAGERGSLEGIWETGFKVKGKYKRFSRV
jgi:hypothetical protein